MWIIYRLWGFLLLKPALGVLQIPAQSTATQSSLLSAESLTHCTSFTLWPKNDTLQLLYPSPLCPNSIQPYWPTAPIRKGTNRLNPSVYKGSSKCDGHTPITSHFLNRKECYRRSTENRVNVEWKKFRGESFRVSPSGVRRCKTGQCCLFRPINRETSVVL